MPEVLLDAASEAPDTVEEDSGDSEVVNHVAGPTMEHVDDDAMRAALEEELAQWFEEGGGVEEGTHRHVGVGYVGGESVNGDGKTGILVARD